jgi:TRAF3-interacting protein 1
MPLQVKRITAAAPLALLQAGLADTEGRTAAARERLIGLKAQVLRNEETLEKLLAMVVAGGRRQ